MNRPRIVHPLDAEERERRETVGAWEERLEAFGLRCAVSPRFALGETATATPDLFLPDFGIHVAVESVDGDDDGGSTWAEEFVSAVGPLLVVRGEPFKPFTAGGGRPECGARLFCYGAASTESGPFDGRAFFARMTDDAPAWLVVETGNATRVLFADSAMRKPLPRVVALDTEAQSRAVLTTWELEP